MKGLSRFGLTMLCVLAMSVPAVAQGVYWESVTKGGPLGVDGTASKTYAMPGRFKHVDDNGKHMMIARLDKKMMYMVNLENNTYAEMTFDEMEAIMNKAGARMDEAMTKLEKEMEGMSAEQRAMMEKMMGGMMKGKSTSPASVKATGESRTISGFRCSEYVASRDGETILSAWTTTGVKEFDAMRKDWEEFSRRMMSMNSRIGGDFVEAFKKIKGFPMETQIAGITSTVTKVERRSIAASEFEVPRGLKKVDKSEFMGGGLDE